MHADLLFSVTGVVQSFGESVVQSAFEPHKWERLLYNLALNLQGAQAGPSCLLLFPPGLFGSCDAGDYLNEWRKKSEAQ